MALHQNGREWHAWRNRYNRTPRIPPDLSLLDEPRRPPSTVPRPRFGRNARTRGHHSGNHGFVGNPASVRNWPNQISSGQHRTGTTCISLGKCAGLARLRREMRRYFGRSHRVACPRGSARGGHEDSGGGAGGSAGAGDCRTCECLGTAPTQVREGRGEQRGLTRSLTSPPGSRPDTPARPGSRRSPKPRHGWRDRTSRGRCRAREPAGRASSFRPARAPIRGRAPRRPAAHPGSG